MKTFDSLVGLLPPPGQGGGYHSAIYRVACAGRDEGVNAARIAEAIRAHTRPGGRVVPEREIVDAVTAAFRREGCGPQPYSGPRIRPGFLDECLKAGRGARADDIKRRSPVPLDWDDEDGWRALSYLAGSDELVFIGDDTTAGALGKSILPVGEWLAVFEQEGGATAPKWIANPLSGEATPKRSGVGQTFRGDSCVAAHRFAVAESDSMSLTDQLAFWAGCPTLPVAMLTLSGSKSIHALVRVDCADGAEWAAEVAGKLFSGCLVPLGMDAACKNPARLTRLPGFYRADTNQIQKCLYLAPDGKAVGA